LRSIYANNLADNTAAAAADDTDNTYLEIVSGALVGHGLQGQGGWGTVPTLFNLMGIFLSPLI